MAKIGTTLCINNTNILMIIFFQSGWLIVKISANSNNIYNFLWVVDKFMGLPRWHSGKVAACQSRRLKRSGFYPWVGKIPWMKKWQPTPVFLPGKFEPGGLDSIGS